MAEFRIEQKPASISQAWRAEGSNAMTRFRVNQVPDQRGSIISDALGNLVGAMKDGVHIQAKLDELSAKLNSENDDLELVKLENLNREMMTNMGQFQTDDAVKDAGEQHKSRLAEWLKSNTQLSAEGRKRAGVMMEKMNGIYRAGAQVRLLDYRRNKIITEDRQFLEQAVAAGDFGGAEKWYAKLEQSMAEYLGKVPEFTREDVKARTAVSAYKNSLNGYGISALREELANIEKREEDGSLNLYGITVRQKDADQLSQHLRTTIAKQINAGEDEIAKRIASGEMNEELADKMYSGGIISANQYNSLKKQFNLQRKNAGKDEIAKRIASGEMNEELADKMYSGGIISANQYNSLKKQFDLQRKNAEKEKHRQAGYKAKETEERHKKNYYDFEYTLIEYEPAWKTGAQIAIDKADAIERLNQLDINQHQKNQLRQKINTTFPVDSEGNKTQGKNDFRNTFNYLNWKQKIKEEKDKWDSYAEAGDWFRDSDTEKANFKMFEVMFDEFMQKNPDATDQEIEMFYNETKKFITNQAVADLVDAWAKVRSGIKGDKKSKDKK